jgi:hypothetical protein
LQRRLNANKGNNPCAKIFGGLANAQKALDEGHFKFENLGPPDLAGGNAVTSGNNVTTNSVGTFMAANGRLPGDSWVYRDLATTQYIFVMTKQGKAYAPVQLGETENAAFILAHELGHLRKIYGKNNYDSDNFDRSTKNNRKIWEACFK